MVKLKMWIYRIILLVCTLLVGCRNPVTRNVYFIEEDYRGPVYVVYGQNSSLKTFKGQNLFEVSNEGICLSGYSRPKGLQLNSYFIITEEKDTIELKRWGKTNGEDVLETERTSDWPAILSEVPYGSGETYDPETRILKTRTPSIFSFIVGNPDELDSLRIIQDARVFGVSHKYEVDYN